MKDVVYILGTGSTWDNNEIRYSLRSLKNLPHGRIFVVGEFPSFLDSEKVIHIPAEDPYKNKTQNGMHKIRAACLDPRISEDFILMNDDFYIMRPIKEVPLRDRGPLALSIKNHPYHAGDYYDAIIRTRNLLRYWGMLNPRDFSMHIPVVYNKKTALTILNSIEWEKYGLLFRTLYLNYLLHPDYSSSISVKDVKHKKGFGDLEQLAKQPIVSSDDHIADDRNFRILLEKTFPDPSPYEL